jgi:hypothetical protein
MAEQEYQRLTRTIWRSLVTMCSLWLGSDHLLSIRSAGFQERYKRFYFRDIQALTIRNTRRRLVWNAVLGCLTALALAVVLYATASNKYPLAGGLSSLVLVFGIPLLVNNLLGPTCACQIRTAVQTEDLPSLNRIRKTRRVLDRIRPLIAEAQGLLTPEEVAANLQQLAAANAPDVAPTSSTPDPDAPPVIT